MTSSQMFLLLYGRSCWLRRGCYVKGPLTHCHCHLLGCKRFRLNGSTCSLYPLITQCLSSHRSRKSINCNPVPRGRTCASGFRRETHTLVVQSGINELALARAPLLTSYPLFHARSLAKGNLTPLHKQPVSLEATPCLVSLFQPHLL